MLTALVIGILAMLAMLAMLAGTETCQPCPSHACSTVHMHAAVEPCSGATRRLLNRPRRIELNWHTQPTGDGLIVDDVHGPGGPSMCRSPDQVCLSVPGRSPSLFADVADVDLAVPGVTGDLLLLRVS